MPNSGLGGSLMAPDEPSQPDGMVPTDPDEKVPPDKVATRRAGAPTAKGAAVIGVTVTFDYEAGFDRSRVTKVAENAAPMFQGMPDLRYKFFTFDEKQGRAMNFYVWDSQDAAESFFSPELRDRVTELYGVPPTIAFVEIAQVVDNSAS
jgi:hypothetical protein